MTEKNVEAAEQVMSALGWQGAPQNVVVVAQVAKKFFKNKQFGIAVEVLKKGRAEVEPMVRKGPSESACRESLALFDALMEGVEQQVALTNPGNSVAFERDRVPVPETDRRHSAEPAIVVPVACRFLSRDHGRIISVETESDLADRSRNVASVDFAGRDEGFSEVYRVFLCSHGDALQLGDAISEYSRTFGYPLPNSNALGARARSECYVMHKLGSKLTRYPAK